MSYVIRLDDKAEFFFETIIPSLSLIVLPNAFEDVIEAARIKAEYPLSYAACFAVADAGKDALDIVTGDPEFKRVEHLY